MFRKLAKRVAKSKNLHLVLIKKNKMKDKNRDLGRRVTVIRSAYERGVFSKQNRRVRYIGIAKNQFAKLMNAICFNLRRLIL